MKKFRKAIVAALALVSMGAIASCNKKAEDPVTYDVTSAAKRVVVEQDKSESVIADFEVAKKVNYKNAEYTVTWTSNNEFATVTNIEGNDAKYLVDINYEDNTSAAQNVKLTAEVADPNGQKVTKEFNFTIPKFIVPMTHAEYLAAEKGDNITIKGTIAYLDKEKDNAFFTVVDAEGKSYYIYSMPLTVDNKASIAQGQTVVLSGVKDVYSGVHELTKATLISATKGTKVDPTSISELTTVTDEEQAKYVTFTGAIKSITNYKNNPRTFVITVGSNDITVYLSRNYNKGKDFAVDDNVTVKGILSVNSGKAQVITLAEEDMTKNA